MCKAHSKVTHIKQQKYSHHLKGRGYNRRLFFRKLLIMLMSGLARQDGSRRDNAEA